MNALVRILLPVVLGWGSLAHAATSTRVGADGVPLEPGYILIHSDDPRVSVDVLDRVSELGGRHLHLWPPSILAGELPPGLTGAELAPAGRVSIYWMDSVGSRPVRGVAPLLDPFESAFLEGWRRGRYHLVSPDIFEGAAWRKRIDSGELTPSQTRSATPEQIEEVRRSVARERVDSAFEQAAAEPERDVDQNSEFLLGRVVLSLILPESVGSGEDVYEDWADEEVSDVLGAIATAWTEITNEYVNSPLDIIYNNKIRVRVTTEPGHHTGKDVTWIEQAMNRLGYVGPPGPEGMNLVHRFNNDARAYFRAQWAVTAFVPDVSTLPGNIMTNSSGAYITYAYRGGPYFMCPYPAGEFGAGFGFGLAFMHEVGQSFWALDETPDKGKPCETESGYLSVKNRNSSWGKPIPCNLFAFLGPCIMQYGWYRICEPTAGQTGIVAIGEFEEGEGIPRIWNVEPWAEFDGGIVDTLIEDFATVKGRAYCPPLANKNPEISPERRIDHSSFLHRGLMSHRSLLRLFKPDDEKWDESEERFTIDVDHLIPGANIVRFTFENLVRVKNLDPIQKTFLVIGINFTLPQIETRDDENVVRWRVEGVDFGAEYELQRMALDGSGIWEPLPPTYEVVVNDILGFKEYTYRDRDRIRPGETYSYRVRGDISIFFRGEQREFTNFSGTRTTTGQAPLSGGLISHVLPNPMREVGIFSVVVPLQYQEGVPGAIGPTAVSPAIRPALTTGFVVPTPTDVSVFNVRGERVRTIHNGGLTGGRHTFFWDGTDDRGQRVTSGIYFIHAQAGPTGATRKVLIVD